MGSPGWALRVVTALCKTRGSVVPVGTVTVAALALAGVVAGASAGLLAAAGGAADVAEDASWCRRRNGTGWLLSAERGAHTEPCEQPTEHTQPESPRVLDVHRTPHDLPHTAGRLALPRRWQVPAGGGG